MHSFSKNVHRVTKSLCLLIIHFRNNGMKIASLNDEGRYKITLNDSDKYKFKVPSLRNVEFTAPYMHDGSLYSLFAVLEHYGYRMENTPNLDTIFKQTYPAFHSSFG